jgi:hypothetical protein
MKKMKKEVSMKKEIDNKKIAVKNGSVLTLNKPALIQIIKDNSDKDSVEIDCSLITMIKCFYGRFSAKQLNWIFEKVKCIFRHNIRYSEYKGVKDIQLL